MSPEIKEFKFQHNDGIYKATTKIHGRDYEWSILDGGGEKAALEQAERAFEKALKVYPEYP